MSTLMWKDLRHHARQWLWSLLVATAGAAVVGMIVISWWSATQWSLNQDKGEYLAASSLIGGNLVGYAGSATAIVISTTLGLTVTAQQRSHALWKVLGIPGSRIRAIILWQVCAVGVIGGLLGGLLALPLGRIYLLTWGEFNLFPRDLPLSMPVFCVPATVLVTTLFSVLGGLGAARRAANVPEMQALREAAAPATRTKPWQWVAAVILLISAASLPILVNLPADVLEEDGTSKAEIAQMQSPGGRAIMGGAVGFMVALAALFIPNWTLRPLLTWWTSLIPGRSPAWFSARANARHRSALSMTTIVPFAIAVSMTGTIHAMGGAARSSGMSNGVSGFLTIMVPIFFVAGVGGVANIAMVGRTRRQEGGVARGDRSPAEHHSAVHSPRRGDIRRHRHSFRAGDDVAQRGLRRDDVGRRSRHVRLRDPREFPAGSHRSVAGFGGRHHVAACAARSPRLDGQPAPADVTGGRPANAIGT